METVIVKNGVYQVGAQCAQTPFLAEMANAAALYYQCNVEDICIDLVSKRISAADFVMSISSYAPVLDNGFCSAPVYCASGVSIDSASEGIEFALSFALGLRTLDSPPVEFISVSSSSLVTYDVRIVTEGGVDYTVVGCSRSVSSLPFGVLAAGYSAIAFPPSMLKGDFVFSYYRAYNKNRV